MSTHLKKRIITSIYLMSLLALMYFYSFIMIISLIIISLIVWIEFYGLISKIYSENTPHERYLRFFYKLISLLYLLSLVYFLFLIEANYNDLRIYVIYSILVSVLSDIGGLVFGKVFKGRKLTKISPNKTISGSIGSFLFSLILIIIFDNNLFNSGYLSLIFITLIISLISQMGDLFISYLKRKANVKDTSDLLPGHGGFLDRVDGIIFAVPAGILLLSYF